MKYVNKELNTNKRHIATKLNYNEVINSSSGLHKQNNFSDRFNAFIKYSVQIFANRSLTFSCFNFSNGSEYLIELKYFTVIELCKTGFHRFELKPC